MEHLRGFDWWIVTVLGVLLCISAVIHVIQWIWFSDERRKLLEEYEVSAGLRNRVTEQTLKRELAEGRERKARLILYNRAAHNIISSLGSHR